MKKNIYEKVYHERYITRQHPYDGQWYICEFCVTHYDKELPIDGGYEPLKHEAYATQEEAKATIERWINEYKYPQKVEVFLPSSEDITFNPQRSE